MAEVDPGNGPAVDPGSGRAGIMKLRPSLAVDLGTVNTLIRVAGGDLVDEPTAIAVSRRTGAVEAVGRDADALAEKEPVDTEIIHPVRDGVIADYDAAVGLLQALLRRAGVRRGLGRPLAAVCVSGGATSLERRVLTAAMAAVLPRGVVRFVDKPVAAAAGAGLELGPGSGAVIVDIGGGTTEMAVLAGGHVVRAQTLRAGGNAMDKAIAQAVRADLGLLIGRDAARVLKTTMGLGGGDAQECEVAGVDAARRTPRVEVIPAKLVAAALEHSAAAIAGAVGDLLADVPPNLAGDVVRGKIRMAGGGALLPGLTARIEAAADIPAYIVDNPLQCVIRGAAAFLAEGQEIAGRRPRPGTASAAPVPASAVPASAVPASAGPASAGPASTGPAGAG
jgi:rod shape-determining protein MreB and related proteins